MSNIENFKPFYHPKYGWQWLDMKQTYEQEAHTRSIGEGNAGNNKPEKILKRPRLSENLRPIYSTSWGTINKKQRKRPSCGDIP